MEKLIDNKWFIGAVNYLRGLGVLTGDGVTMIANDLKAHKSDISLFLKNKRSVSKPVLANFKKHYDKYLSGWELSEQKLESENEISLESILNNQKALSEQLAATLVWMQKIDRKLDKLLAVQTDDNKGKKSAAPK